MRELGLFTGTFNPIHWGHLLIAESARDQFALGKVIFVTASIPPHKRKGLLEPQARFDMVEAAIADNPFFESSRIELDREGPSYTIDTVRHFRMLFPDARINLILGGDNVPYIHQWHEGEELLKMVRLLLAPRPQGQPSSPPEPAVENSAVIECPAIGISGSEIRRRIQQHRSILYMVPPSVNAIIHKHHYYKEAPSD